MRLLRTTIISGAEDTEALAAFEPIRVEIAAAIALVVNPPGASDFAINPTRKGNGVLPMKDAFIESLKVEGWVAESHLTGEKPKIVKGESRAGAVDALRPAKGGTGAFAVEWETGNISSSHRALNKICLGMMDRAIFGGAIVLPSRGLYRFLTDRIGSYQELEPYFRLWARVTLPRPSILAAFEVEHDRTDSNVPQIRKGSDGNAKKGSLDWLELDF